MARISIYVSPELEKRIKNQADRQGVKVSWLVSRILDQTIDTVTVSVPLGENDGYPIRDKALSPSERG